MKPWSITAIAIRSCCLIASIGLCLDAMGEEEPPPTPLPTPEAIWQDAAIQTTPLPTADIDLVPENTPYYVYWGPNVPNHPQEVWRYSDESETWVLITPTPTYIQVQGSPQKGYFRFEESGAIAPDHYHYLIFSPGWGPFPMDLGSEPPEWKGGIVVATHTPTPTFTPVPVWRVFAEDQQTPVAVINAAGDLYVEGRVVERSDMLSIPTPIWRIDDQDANPLAALYLNQSTNLYDFALAGDLYQESIPPRIASSYWEVQDQNKQMAALYRGPGYDGSLFIRKRVLGGGVAPTNTSTPTPSPMPTPIAIWQSAGVSADPTHDIDSLASGTSYYVHWGSNLPAGPYFVARKRIGEPSFQQITPTPTYNPTEGYYVFEESDSLAPGVYSYYVAGENLLGIGLSDEGAEPPVWQGGIDLYSTRLHSTYETAATDLDGPMSMAISDFDGDGIKDIAIAEYSGGLVSWIANDGFGDFSAPIIIDDDAPDVSCIRSGDMDGDEIVDIVACSEYGFLKWYQNVPDATGPMWAVHIIDDLLVGVPQQIVLGDVDGDGDLDIVLATDADDKIVLYENDDASQNLFVRHVVYDGGSHFPTTVKLADVDQDYDDDIVFGISASDSLYWIRNMGDGSFDSAVTLIDAGADGINGIAVDTLTGKIFQDLVVTTEQGGEVIWYKNVVGSGFDRIPIAEDLPSPSDVLLCDMDGDYDSDIVVSCRNTNSGLVDLLWFENVAGNGDVWRIREISSSLGGAVAVEKGDLDGNLRDDVVLALYDEGKIVWYKSDVPTPTPTPLPPTMSEVLVPNENVTTTNLWYRSDYTLIDDGVLPPDAPPTDSIYADEDDGEKEMIFGFSDLEDPSDFAGPVGISVNVCGKRNVAGAMLKVRLEGEAWSTPDEMALSEDLSWSIAYFWFEQAEDLADFQLSVTTPSMDSEDYVEITEITVLVSGPVGNPTPIPTWASPDIEDAVARLAYPGAETTPEPTPQGPGPMFTCCWEHIHCCGLNSQGDHATGQANLASIMWIAEIEGMNYREKRYPNPGHYGWSGSTLCQYMCRLESGQLSWNEAVCGTGNPNNDDVKGSFALDVRGMYFFEYEDDITEDGSQWPLVFSWLGVDSLDGNRGDECLNYHRTISEIDGYDANNDPIHGNQRSGNTPNFYGQIGSWRPRIDRMLGTRLVTSDISVDKRWDPGHPVDRFPDVPSTYTEGGVHDNTDILPWKANGPAPDPPEELRVNDYRIPGAKAYAHIFRPVLRDLGTKRDETSGEDYREYEYKIDPEPRGWDWSRTIDPKPREGDMTLVIREAEGENEKTFELEAGWSGRVVWDFMWDESEEAWDGVTQIEVEFSGTLGVEVLYCDAAKVAQEYGITRFANDSLIAPVIPNSNFPCTVGDNVDPDYDIALAFVKDRDKMRTGSFPNYDADKTFSTTICFPNDCGEEYEIVKIWPDHTLWLNSPNEPYHFGPGGWGNPGMDKWEEQDIYPFGIAASKRATGRVYLRGKLSEKVRNKPGLREIRPAILMCTNAACDSHEIVKVEGFINEETLVFLTWVDEIYLDWSNCGDKDVPLPLLPCKRYKLGMVRLDEDSGEYDVVSESEGVFHIMTRPQADHGEQSWAALMADIGGFVGAYPAADALLDLFLGQTANSPPGSFMDYRDLSPRNAWLENRVGLTIDPDNGNVAKNHPHVTFTPESEFATTCLNNPDFRKESFLGMLERMQGGAYEELSPVIEFFKNENPDALEHTFIVRGDPDGEDNIMPYSADSYAMGPFRFEPFYALGAAYAEGLAYELTFKREYATANEVRLTEGYISGRLLDLYDFEMAFNPEMVAVQALYDKSIDNRGRIFTTEVNFDRNRLTLLPVYGNYFHTHIFDSSFFTVSW